jgi:hypothetical protein
LGAVADGEPVFVLVLDGDDLIGGVAFQRLYKGSCEWIRLLGDGALEPDHLDLVAVPDRVADVVQAIAGWIRRPGNRVVQLQGLVDASWLVGALPGRARPELLKVAPFTPLPGDMASYLSGRPGQVRSTVKRSTKRLASAGIAARVRDATDVDAALDDLHRLHDARWGSQSSFLDSWPKFSAAIRAGAAAGEVRFTDLADRDGRVVAIELELIVGRRASFYQAGRLDERDLRGSGSVLKAAVIDRLIDDGCTEFDLLRGDEPYKADWSAAHRRIMVARAGIGPLGLAGVAGAYVKREGLYRGRLLHNRITEARSAQEAELAKQA